MFIMMDPIMSDVTPTALEHEELLTKLLDNIWQNEFSNIFTFLMTLANLIYSVSEPLKTLDEFELLGPKTILTVSRFVEMHPLLGVLYPLIQVKQ